SSWSITGWSSTGSGAAARTGARRAGKPGNDTPRMPFRRGDRSLMALASIDLARPVDIRAGDIELRLAESADEVAAAQRLRYQVFYEEMAAQPTAEMAAARRDADMFDPYCDHLLVIDHQIG